MGEFKLGREQHRHIDATMQKGTAAGSCCLTQEAQPGALLGPGQGVEEKRKAVIYV